MSLLKFDFRKGWNCTFQNYFYSDPILQRCVDPRLFFHLFGLEEGGRDDFPGQDVSEGVGVRIEGSWEEPYLSWQGGEKIRITNLRFESGFVSPRLTFLLCLLLQAAVFLRAHNSHVL